MSSGAEVAVTAGLTEGDGAAEGKGAGLSLAEGEGSGDGKGPRFPRFPFGRGGR